MSTLKVKHFNLIEDMDISALTFAAIERVEAFGVATAKVAQTWIRRSQERRMLLQMSAHMLDDIGLTPGDVANESTKFFWQK
ncbi:MAG: DUF1127 domain-containing protein [Gammaproteobacteria bacterium]|nr:DUF1127 domain-containing protein [Gammaproteobacteria bacterium]